MKKQALGKSLEFIGSWLRFRYEQNEIPGYAVAIAHKGEIVFNEVYGYANLETKTELTTSHIFRIASHSKTFTATALMQLQEAGKLRIDDYAIDYLPWLNDHKDKRWQKVTLRQLMSHGAGVIRDGLNADYWQLERPFPNKDELKHEVLEADLVLDNNVKLKYSNFGYSLLGMVIETVSGQSYNAYVTEHIVKSLGLKNTGPEYTKSIDGTLVTGYTGREVNKTRLPIAQIDTHAMAAATGFYSTAEDLCAYFTAHMVGSKKLLSDESKKEMQRVQYHAYTPGGHGHVDYGLGMEIEFVGRRKALGHGGGFPGHITKSMFDPQNEIVVVVLTNCLGGPATAIAKGIYGILDYYQKNIPTVRPKHDLSKLEGRYMNLWSMTDIVVTGDKVAATYPNTWQPLTQPEKLERVDDTTLKVLETNSFMSEGELVHFNIKNDKVETVNYNGTTMWPEAVWKEKQLNRDTVRL
jgi:CubicO group peptidase (beta-lactamase class C family)